MRILGEKCLKKILSKIGSGKMNHTILERTLIAEYLLSRGYLMSELDELDFEFVQNLVQMPVGRQHSGYLKSNTENPFCGNLDCQ
jgi:hypothetical protein